MHVSEHLDGSGAHGNIYILENMFIGSEQIATEPFQVVFDNIEIGFEAFFSFGHLVLFGHIFINGVHEFVVVTGLLIQLNAQVQEHELENVLPVLFSEIFELFDQG